MQLNHQCIDLSTVLQKTPDASATVSGSKQFPRINGMVDFYQTDCGVLLVAEVEGLPAPQGQCAGPVFGFHIHSGSECTGNESDPFANALAHYNPGNCPHPYHAGDLPPLFGNNGYAYQAVLTNRFRAEEVVGKTVIIHLEPDDFKTQPSGDSGEKIACGIIVRYSR